MVACVYISNPFNRTRLQVSNIDLQNNVAGFKNTITDTIGIQPCKQELVYMGECLEDEQRSLHSYGIENDVTVFVFEKVEHEEEKSEDVAMSLDELQGILNKARNPLYKQSVKWLVKNKESLKKAIKNITSLKNDRVTTALVEDSDVLLAIIETAIPEKLIENYPTLCIVLKNIISNVSMDSSGQQPFQDDDEESEFLGIDPAFLAQAEMLAASEEQQASTSQQTPRPAANQQARHRISASDLANALSFASMTPTGTTVPPTTTDTTTYSSTTTTSVSQEQTETALQQMRALGITDDELSRRALNMTGGIVEAAVNLIFEGTMI